MADDTQRDAAGAPPRQAGEPYCANCGYSLLNLTDASKCPECGKPLVEVLARWGGASRRARRYRSEAELFGVPIVSVAFGARPEFGEINGRAVGIIAIGNIARGGIAIGGNAVGVVAIGGMAIGLGSVGGMSIGLVTALGGMTIGGFAVGGFGIGGVASGGGAVGIVAQGGMAIGYYASGGGVFGQYILSPRRSDPEAANFFQAAAPVLGGAPGGGGGSGFPMTQAAVVSLSLLVLMAMLVVGGAVYGHITWASRNAARPGARA
ncbi:MAG: hypothetical protein KF699_11325 [Phycisphaeraceae bacterium]|nr:hypothetical protein [Phycisphaeraceae bacterium]